MTRPELYAELAFALKFLVLSFAAAAILTFALAAAGR